MMKKQLALILCIALLLPVLLTGCSKEVSVTAGTLSNVSFDGSATGKTKEDYTATLTADTYFEILAENINVTVDGKALESGWTYDPVTGKLTVSGSSITGDVTISASASHKAVSVDDSGLVDVTYDGPESTKTLEDFTATLTAEELFEVAPETITVTVGGKALESGWSYDPATGELTIEAANITGDIAITAASRESLLGSWEGSIDITTYLNEQMATAGLGDYYVFSDMTMSVVMTFTEEGETTLAIDKDSVNDLMDSLLEQMKGGMNTMLQDLLDSYQIDMTVDEYLQASGTTLDELLEDSMDTAMSDDLFEELEQEGYYSIEDGLLFIADEKDEKMADDEANPYTIEDGVLTIEVSEENEDAEYASFMFPMVLTRVD
jgi:phage baseplate assembly protein gpV